MRISYLLKLFAKDECGAVTVDWVVLTAAIVGLGIAVVAAVNSGVGGLGGGIEMSLSNATVNPINLDQIQSGGGAGAGGGEG